MERLVRRGHDVRVVDFEIGWSSRPAKPRFQHRTVFPDVEKVVEGGGLPVVRPAMIRAPVLDYISATVSHYLEIRRQLKEFRPHVLVGFGILNASTGIRLARRHHIPFVYYLIDELHRLVPQPAFRWLSKTVEQANLRRSTKVLSINSALQEYTIRMGAAIERTEVLPAGIDLNRYMSADGSEIRQQYDFAKTDLVLFFMGWMYPFSGLRDVAAAIVTAPQGAKTPKLLAVGRGELFEDLQRLAGQPNAERRIVVLPWQPYPEIPKYLAAADVCILPAENVEVMQNIVPIKMYEYMAAGKPVVASRLAGLQKEFPEGQGVVYVDRPSDSVAKALELAGDDRIHQLGLQARLSVSRNDWEAVTDRFEALLSGLVEDARAKLFNGRQVSA
jgi:glycosyltransferase involved in cell wall biosynthesis